MDDAILALTNCSNVQGKVIGSSISLAAALGLFVGHGNDYEGGKNVAQEMSAVIPDLPAVSSPATMDEEKVRSEKEEKRKESDTHTLSKSKLKPKANELKLKVWNLKARHGRLCTALNLP